MTYDLKTGLFPSIRLYLYQVFNISILQINRFGRTVRAGGSRTMVSVQGFWGWNSACAQLPVGVREGVERARASGQRASVRKGRMQPLPHRSTPWEDNHRTCRSQQAPRTQGHRAGRFSVSVLGVRVWCFGFRVSGFEASNWGLAVSNSRLEGSNFGFGISHGPA